MQYYVIMVRPQSAGAPFVVLPDKYLKVTAEAAKEEMLMQSKDLQIVIVPSA